MYGDQHIFTEFVEIVAMKQIHISVICVERTTVRLHGFGIAEIYCKVCGRGPNVHRFLCRLRLLLRYQELVGNVDGSKFVVCARALFSIEGVRFGLCNPEECYC
jgi:hypothetical protein